MVWWCLGWGNDIHELCVKKIKLKINRLRAKILLCTHLSPRVEEECAEM